MMAIRGHNNDDGALLNLFTSLADFDPTAAAYLKQLEEIRSSENRKKPEVNFLSPLKIRRILNSIKELIIDCIVGRVAKQGAFSLISDGTQDSFKLEAEAVFL